MPIPTVGVSALGEPDEIADEIITRGLGGARDHAVSSLAAAPLRRNIFNHSIRRGSL